MGKRNDIDKAVRNIMNWAERPEWATDKATVFNEHIAPVCDKMNIDSAELGEELGESGYGGMLFGIVFEDFLTRRWPPDDRNVIDDYIKRRGWRESPRGRQYLKLLRDSALSIYEVVAVTRGQHCDLQDLFRGGKPVRVYEHMGTQNLVKWDRLAARVLSMEGKHTFSGGILPLSQEIGQSALRMLNNSRDQFKKGLLQVADQTAIDRVIPPETADYQLLQTACPGISSLWIMNTLTKLRAPLPEMVNRDGDALVFGETRFPFLAENHDEIARRLDASPEWERTQADEDFWQWFAQPDAKAGIVPKKGMAFDSQMDGGHPVSGTLELQPGVLLFCANSVQRTEKGKHQLEQILQGLIGPALSALQTPEQLMANKSPAEHKNKQTGDIDPEIAAGVVHDFLDNHYRQCLDEPIPMLGDKTPRQCAKSKKDREKVIDWLKYLENGELHRAAGEGQKPYDTGWMWDELKLSRPRD
jgi:hypothetical protein